MPIYDYRCTSCGKQFELLVRGEQAVACPRCSGKELERLISLPARPFGMAPEADQRRHGQPMGGGCCGGACQSHSH